MKDLDLETEPLVRQGLAAGRRLGRFVLLDELGRGGMGVVHRAYDPDFRRLVAIKRILLDVADAEDLERFRREGAALAALSHPGIARLHELVLEGPGAPFQVQEFVQGSTLHEVTRLGLEAGDAAAIVADAAEAVAAAHAQGIVHRDIKPANLILTPEGRVVVLDFGLAKRAESRTLTETGALLGTPAYMAPEQLEGAATPNVDVYALGAVLYECLAGQRAFVGASTFEVLDAVANRPPQPLPATVPPGLRAICLASLSKDPRDRPPSAEALARALRSTEDLSSRGSRVVGLLVGTALVGVMGLAVLVFAGGWAAPPAPEPEGTPSQAVEPSPAASGTKGGRNPEARPRPEPTSLDELRALVAARTTPLRARGLVQRALAEASPREEVELLLLLAELDAGAGNSEGALGNLSRVLSLDPQHLAARLRRAGALRRAGRPAEAVADLRFALEASPDPRRILLWLDEVVAHPLPEESVRMRATWLYWRGVTRRKAGDVEGALADAIRSQKVNPRARSDPQQLRWEILVEHRRFQEALEVAESLLKARSKSLRVQAWTQIAFSQEALGRYAEERDALLELLTLRDTVSARVSLFAALRHLGDHEGAEEACTRGIELDPSAAHCYALRAEARLTLGKPSALADAERALELSPQDLDYREVALRAGLRFERWDRAVVHARVMTERSPGDFRSHLRLGSAYMELGRLPEGIRSLREAHRLKVLPATSARLGSALIETGQSEQALRYLQEARSLGLEHPTLYQDLGRVSLELGRYTEALAQVRALRSLDPQNPVAFVLEGDALRNLGERGGALEAYAAALDLDPDHHVIRFQRSGLWLEEGLFANALADVGALLEIAPGDVDYLARRGEIYEALQERDLALADYRRVLDLAPAHPRASEMRAYSAQDR